MPQELSRILAPNVDYMIEPGLEQIVLPGLAAYLRLHASLPALCNVCSESKLVQFFRFGARCVQLMVFSLSIQRPVS